MACVLKCMFFFWSDFHVFVGAALHSPAPCLSDTGVPARLQDSPQQWDQRQRRTIPIHADSKAHPTTVLANRRVSKRVLCMTAETNAPPDELCPTTNLCVQFELDRSETLCVDSSGVQPQRPRPSSERARGLEPGQPIPKQLQPGLQQPTPALRGRLGDAVGTAAVR